MVDKKEKPVMGRPVIHTEEYMEKIAKELDKWSMNEGAFFIKEFTCDHKDDINNDTFVEWCENSPNFFRTYRKVRDRLTSRLRKAGLNKDTDSQLTMRLLPLVDSEYKEWRREELGLEAESKKTSITNVISWKDAKKIKSK